MSALRRRARAAAVLGWVFCGLGGALFGATVAWVLMGDWRVSLSLLFVAAAALLFVGLLFLRVAEKAVAELEAAARREARR